MRIEHYFPAAQILLCIGASVVYVCKGNWRMMMYWVAAALITTCVTLGDK